MAILGTLLKNGIRIRESLEQEYSDPAELQKNELKKLLIHARNTQFGQAYGFQEILKTFKKRSNETPYEAYAARVPVHDYNKMYNNWWHKCREGEKGVCWPGPVKYYALSSGTSEASSKYIPLTKDMLKAIKKTGVRQLLTLGKYPNIPAKVFEKGILMLGGSTHLSQGDGFFEGDLSGITAAQLPIWFRNFYKPGQKIAKKRDWNAKLDEITRAADKWDIGVIVGVPAWLQLLLEKIIAYYKVDNIHEIWPNLTIFCHGGVSFEPYRKGFERLLGKPLVYMETYLASEGFIALQSQPNVHSMRMVLNNGIFYEFVPFDSENFDADGNLVENPKTVMIGDVEENTEYALLLTSVAGAYRYIIGDVIKFVSKEDAEIVITGRTQHFLSLCGEHLSVDNMNKVVSLASEHFNIEIKEFTVAGIPHGTLFAHHWYIGTDDEVDAQALRDFLDAKLCELNDDYATERRSALRDVLLDTLPSNTFYQWLKHQGKEGGQNKFPRVLKKGKLKDWQDFLA